MFISTAHACKRLGISSSTLNNMIRRGEIEGIRIGNLWKVRPEVMR